LFAHLREAIGKSGVVSISMKEQGKGSLLANHFGRAMRSASRGTRGGRGNGPGKRENDGEGIGSGRVKKGFVEAVDRGPRKSLLKEDPVALSWSRLVYGRWSEKVWRGT